jgi:hypothetical protein
MSNKPMGLDRLNLTESEQAFVLDVAAEAKDRIAGKYTPKRSELQERRYQKVLERIKIWERKRKLAETKLASLNKQRRYYERQD